MAKLGSRLNGIQEARGSNPLISTKKNRLSVVIRRFSHFRVMHLYSCFILAVTNK